MTRFTRHSLRASTADAEVRRTPFPHAGYDLDVITLSRRLLPLLAIVALGATVAACAPDPPYVIGRPGLGDGEFRDPRGIAVSEQGIAVLDRTGRLQILELDGSPRQTLTIVPGDVRRGLPIGLAWLPDGRLAVADTHSSRMRLIDPVTGAETVFGDYGVQPGEFLFPQRVSLRSDGDLLISDHGMGATNRIQVLALDGSPKSMFGGPDDADGGLVRPMGVVPLPDGGSLVADQVAGIVHFGEDGACLGQLPEWPFGDEVLAYGLCRAPDGTLYVTDLVGHRILRLRADGALTGVLGREGTEPGEFREPWDIAWHAGYLYVADMGNHRVQRFDARAADWRNP